MKDPSGESKTRKKVAVIMAERREMTATMLGQPMTP